MAFIPTWIWMAFIDLVLYGCTCKEFIFLHQKALPPVVCSISTGYRQQWCLDLPWWPAMMTDFFIYYFWVFSRNYDHVVNSSGLIYKNSKFSAGLPRAKLFMSMTYKSKCVCLFSMEIRLTMVQKYVRIRQYDVLFDINICFLHKI